jgi:hypothetical protein
MTGKVQLKRVRGFHLVKFVVEVGVIAVILHVRYLVAVLRVDGAVKVVAYAIIAALVPHLGQQ